MKEVLVEYVHNGTVLEGYLAYDEQRTGPLPAVLVLLMLLALPATVGGSGVLAIAGAAVLIGFGLSGCSFNLVLAAFGKLLPEEMRPRAQS